MLDRQPQPAHGQRREAVPVGRNKNITALLADFQEFGDDPAHACGDISRSLAVRGTVTPQIPSGTVRADVRGGAALVRPVVPLGEIVAHLRPLTEAGDPAGLQQPP